MTFPELYPRNATPSIDFLPGTTLPIIAKANLQKVIFFKKNLKYQR